MSKLTRPSQQETLRRASKEDIEELKSATDKLKESTKSIVESKKATRDKKIHDGESKIDSSTKENKIDNKQPDKVLNKIKTDTGDILKESKSSNVILEKISKKLESLSDKLNLKVDEAKSKSTTAPIKNESTSDILVERLNEEEKEENTDNVSPRIIREEEKPSNRLLSSNDTENDNDVNGAPKERDSRVESALLGVKGILKEGFKKSLSISERISSSLFKVSVAQAINGAKIAAAIFSIILAIDILKMFWESWGDKIMESFDKMSVKFGEWWESFKGWADDFVDFKDVFDNMAGNIMQIRDAWTSGDFPALVSAIGGLWNDLGKTLSAIIVRAITKLSSTILKALGFGESADRLEANGLEYYQNLTNSKLTDENARKVAENQTKKEKEDNLTPTQRGVTSFLPDNIRHAVGILSDNEYDQIKSEKQDQKAKASLSDEDKVLNTMATNEARKAVERYRKLSESANPTNKNDMIKVESVKKEAQEFINQKALALTPTVKNELQKQFESVSTKKSDKEKVKPNKPTETKDAQTVKNIKTADLAKSKASDIVANATANVNNTVIKTNKNISIQAPITSTRAPGIFKSTGVN